MAKYNFTINNYHAIKEANLELDGITVIAGVNGCGKSTISRWLYYIVNTLDAYDVFLFSDFKDKVIKELERVHMVLDDISVSEERKHDYEHVLAMMSMLTLRKDGVTKLGDYYKKAIRLLEEILIAYFQHETNENQVFRVLNLMGVSDKDHLHEQLESYFKQLFSNMHNVYVKNKKQRSKEYLMEKILSFYKEKDNAPKLMSLKEDKVELLAEKVGKAYNLDNAIYVGTPTAISLRLSDKVMLASLARKMFEQNENHVCSDNEKSLCGVIREMIHGTIIEKEELDSAKLVYRGNEGKDIKVEDVASGYKPLIYILRLIENGWLTKSTLLEIDEPETNLHPQWVVEFAHLLVKIHKLLGTKILITTHHPDMVSAVKYIAEFEELADSTKFYVATQVENTLQYEYLNLGNDIDPVFDSFNQSFVTLEKYASAYGNL